MSAENFILQDKEIVDIYWLLADLDRNLSDTESRLLERLRKRMYELYSIEDLEAMARRRTGKESAERGI